MRTVPREAVAQPVVGILIGLTGIVIAVGRSTNASEDSAHVTGYGLVVDGGYTAK